MTARNVTAPGLNDNADGNPVIKEEHGYILSYK